MEMDYNVSDLEKLLNIHNEHEFIIIYTERAKELLDIFLENFSSYNELILFLQMELKIFSEWENDFFKDQPKNITYISLDSYEHDNELTKEEEFKKLISYLQMFHTGSKILFKFYNELKQIDVTYDIQTHVNTLEEKYKNMFYNIHKIGPISDTDSHLSEPQSVDSLQYEFDKLSKRDDNNNNSNDDNDNNNNSNDDNDNNNNSNDNNDDDNNSNDNNDDDNNSNDNNDDDNNSNNSNHSNISNSNKTNEDYDNNSNDDTSNKDNEIIISNNGIEIENIGDLLNNDIQSSSITATNNSKIKINDDNCSDKKEDNINDDDLLFNTCNKIINNMEKIKGTYLTLKENKSSIKICRDALNTILSYGLDVETALGQLDNQDNKIDNIINKYANMYEIINNNINDNMDSLIDELEGVKFKQQIKDIKIE